MPDAFIIDRQPALAHFRAMLGAERVERILRLVGDAKMGKSHMLRVYRRVAEQEWQARCALVDLRSRLQDYSDLLDVMVQQLGRIHFESYKAVHDELASRPQVQVSGLKALFSQVSLKAEGAGAAEHRRRITAAFLQDMAAVPPQPPILLLFDALEQAERPVQDWLNENLLIGLSRMPHVWTVLAGRTLPEPLITWCDVCFTYELPPVPLEDCRAFCAHIGAELTDELISGFYQVFEGKPGYFVDMVAPKYGRRGVAA